MFSVVILEEAEEGIEVKLEARTRGGKAVG